MHRFTVAATVMVLGATLAACQIGGRGAAPLPTPQVPSTAEAQRLLDRSLTAYNASLTYVLNWNVDVGGQEDILIGDGAFLHGNSSQYVRWRINDHGSEPDDIIERHLSASDMYLRTRDGRWWVESPWNVGIPLGESIRDDPNVPPIDYPALIAALEKPSVVDDVQAVSSAHVRGEAKLTDFWRAWAAGAGESAMVDVVVNTNSGVPERVTVEVSGKQGFTAKLVYGPWETDGNFPQPPADARPLKEAQYPDADCNGHKLGGCLAAATGIDGAASCAGAGKRVCLAPLGNVDADLVRHLVDHFAGEYGLSVTVLQPAPLPASLVNPKRGQIGDDALLGELERLYLDDYGNPEVVLIGITPVDVFMESKHYRYVLGVRLTEDQHVGFVSTARMNPAFYGDAADEELLYTRAERMVAKYVGGLYYALPDSDDRRSAMYNGIGGPDALDDMTQPLQVPSVAR